MSAQIEPVTLSWSQLSVRIDSRPKGWLPAFCRSSEEKVLLDNATGSVDGGTLLAVMGASGTGKTTLLSAITKRLRGKTVTGDVLVNGRAASAEFLSEICGFVPQRDIATETLTATEHLAFMAALRMDARTPPAARARRIRVLLADLGLTACADTRLAVLSGGERRRLAVAAQLLMMPRILVLDEPCSGLDGEASLLVLDALKLLASRGCAVVLSVHQVSAEALALFDELLVLAHGRVAYHGPLDDACSFLMHAELKFLPEWQASSPLLGVLYQLSNPSEASECPDMHKVCSEFSRSPYARYHREHPTSQDVLEKRMIELSRIERSSWWTQFKWLCWRGLLDTSRRRNEHFSWMAITFGAAILLSFGFSAVSGSSPTVIQNMSGVLFLMSSEIIFTHAYCVFNTFPSELPIYLRESSLYSPSAFYANKVVLSIPRALIHPLIYSAIIQCQVDLTGGASGWAALLSYGALSGTLVLSAVTAAAYGCMLSAQFQSADMVFITTMPVETITMLVAGIFSNVQSLPAYLIWTKFVSMFYYAYESLSIVFWNNVDVIDCSQAQAQGKPCASSGRMVLENLGFSPEHVSRNWACLALLCVAFHLLGFLGVWRRSRQPSVY